MLAIIGTMLGLLLPAVQRSQARARETVCQNNIRQMGFALSHWQEVQRKVPEAPRPGCVGGWSYDILDFMEERALRRWVGLDAPIDSVLEAACQRPGSMRCPDSPARTSSSPPMDATHFVMVVRPGRMGWRLLDAPINARHPWLSVPDYSLEDLRQSVGPHRRGFHYANSSGEVDWMPPGDGDP